MMSYQFQSTRNNSSGRFRLLVVTGLVILVFFGDSFTGGNIRAGARATGSFIWVRCVGVVEFFANTGFFSSRRSLENQIRALSDEVQRLNDLNAEDAVLRDENDQLRALVNIAKTNPGITAPIISSFRSSPYGTFVVGAGQGDGVQQGSLVVSPGKFVIGVISDVGAHSSLVRATFAPNSQIDAVIAGSAVIVEGRGAGNAHARLPHGVEAKVGDPVTAATFGGHAIGIVGKVISESAGAYSDVYIGLPVSLEAMKYVYIEQ